MTLEEQFLLESNKIEGILRPANEAEKAAFKRFMGLDAIEIANLCDLVKIFQPDAALRIRRGLDVRIGSYYPPKGGPEISKQLSRLLDKVNNSTIDPWNAHVEYETLHPFTDGNGRSGRMLWWWMTGGSPLGFLHKFYYQTLDKVGKR